MPEMTQCGYHTRMCRLIPDWPLCTPSSIITPRMQMYFHLGMLDYILFQSWVPVTKLYYSLSILVVIIMAMGAEDDHCRSEAVDFSNRK